jgi:hypothetical protein
MLPTNDAMPSRALLLGKPQRGVPRARLGLVDQVPSGDRVAFRPPVRPDRYPRVKKSVSSPGRPD